MSKKIPVFVLFQAVDSKGYCRYEDLIRTNADEKKGTAYLKRFCQRSLREEEERGPKGDITLTAQVCTDFEKVTPEVAGGPTLAAAGTVTEGDSLTKLTMLDVALVQTEIEHQANVMRMKYASSAGLK